MTRPRTLVLDLTTIEAAHLASVTGQFLELVDASDTTDPAVTRLVPDAYPDDGEASREFRRLTETELLGRRAEDARAVLATLARSGELPEPTELDEAGALAPRTVSLAPHESAAWLRTLAAVRLVLASRLGIQEDDDHPVADPRFLLYDWLGQRLDGLVAALES